MPDAQKHLFELLAGFKTGVLVTHSGDGLHARPMAVAELARDRDPVFAAGADSPKVAEISANPEVLVTFQSSSSYATISGTATVVKDRAEIDRLWTDAWRVWFPGGKDDASLCLIRVRATAGEYWDSSGMQGLSYLFEGMKAVVQKRKAETDESQHAKVPL